MPLTVEKVELPPSGNLQAEAREARYALAEAATTGDFAAAHTASDQAETVLYRLAVSPGSRALQGHGGPARPAGAAAARGDARGGARVPARPLPPVARGPVERRRPLRARPRATRGDHRAEAPQPEGRAHDRARPPGSCARRPRSSTSRPRTRSQALGGGPAVPLAALEQLPAALRRLVLRTLAESAAGASRPLSRREAEDVLALGSDGTQVARPRRRPAGRGGVRHGQVRAGPRGAAPDAGAGGAVRAGQRALRRRGR